MNVKEAAYSTVCGACDCRITEGDDIALTDGEWVHASCAEDVRRETDAVVCTECWIIKPCECAA